MRNEGELRKSLKDIADVTGLDYKELKDNLEVRTLNLMKANNVTDDFSFIKYMNKAYIGVLNYIKEKLK